MTRAWCVLILSLCIPLIDVQAWATTYYVDRAIGSDSNTGTGQGAGTSGPLFSIQGAFNKALVGGDIVYIKNGTYTEKLSLSKSGTNGNPITIRNFIGHAPVINTGTFPTPTHVAGDLDRRLFIAANKHDIVIRGLEITNGFDAIKIDSGADRITIKKMNIHDTYGNGIMAPGCTDCVVTHNRFTRIAVKFDDAGCPDGVNFGICNQVHGMYVTGQRWRIHNNIFEDSAGGWGLQLAAYGTADYPGVSASYLGFTGTISHNSFSYTRRMGGIVMYRATQPCGATIENNIFYENNQLSYGGNSAGVDFYNACSGNVVRNNRFYSTAPGATAAFTDNLGGRYTSTNNKINIPISMINAPSTVPGSPDYHLPSSVISTAPGFPSLAPGFPDTLLVSDDYDDVIRGTIPEIGPYEFSSSTDTIPPATPVGLAVN